MSIEAHIDVIAAKRENLKDRIAEEAARPSPNFEAIREMKKQNLALKEEMQRYLILLGAPAYNTSS